MSEDEKRCRGWAMADGVIAPLPAHDAARVEVQQSVEFVSRKMKRRGLAPVFSYRDNGCHGPDKALIKYGEAAHKFIVSQLALRGQAFNNLTNRGLGSCARHRAGPGNSHRRVFCSNSGLPALSLRLVRGWHKMLRQPHRPRPHNYSQKIAARLGLACRRNWPKRCQGPSLIGCCE